MQYKTGTVAVTNGSPTVTGTGTTWLGNVSVGSVFVAAAEGVPYIVAAVPGNGTITLASNYGGTTRSGIAYSLTTSYTPNQKIPYMEQGDIDTATIWKRAAIQIDTLLGVNVGAAAQANRVVFTDVSGNLTTSANLTYGAAGTLVVGGAFAGGSAAAGDVVLSNTKALRSVNGATSDSVPLIYADSGNNINLPGNVWVNAAAPSVTIGNGGTGTTVPRIDVNGGSGAGGGSYIRFARNGTYTGYVGLEAGIQGNSSSDLMFYSSTANIKLLPLGLEALRVVGVASGARIVTITNATSSGNPTIDVSGGNLAITPFISMAGSVSSTWSGYSAGVEIAGGAISGPGTDTLEISQNIYTVAAAPKYKTTGFYASRIQMQSGVISFVNTSTSGTAGNAVSFTELARFTTGGYFKASNSGTYINATGAYHELYSDNNAANEALQIKNNAATATNQYGAAIVLGGDPNDTTRYFMRGVGNATTRVNIFSNGNLTNTNNSYGAISDARFKTDVQDAKSQWGDVLAFRLRNFGIVNADGSISHRQLGLIAQEAVKTSPGVVTFTREGMMEKMGVQYSVVNMKVLGALQETMRRLEALEQWAAQQGYRRAA